MSTSSDENPVVDSSESRREQRREYWDNYRPKLIKAEDAIQIDDWRSVDLESLSPLNRRIVEEFRSRASELGIELSNAPVAATDMYKSPYTNSDNLS